MEELLKILIVSTLFFPLRTAEADYVHTLADNLHKVGHDVTLVTKNRGWKSHADYRFIDPYKRWGLLEAFFVFLEVQKLKPDLVILVLLPDKADLIANSILCALCKAFLRKTVFSTYFTYVDYYKGKWPLKLKQKIAYIGGEILGSFRFGAVLLFSDVVVVMSQVQEKFLSSLKPRFIKKLAVLPPPSMLSPIVVDPDLSRSFIPKELDHLMDKDFFLITFFGRIYPGKGIDLLLDAIPEVLLEIPHARLLLLGGELESQIGGSYLAELRMRASRLGIEGRVMWSGEFENGSIWPQTLMNRTDLFVLPFLNGAQFNNSSIAACFTAGKPTILTQNPLEKESKFIHLENCFIVNAGSSEELASGIKHLAKNKEVCDRISAEALKFSREFYDPKLHALALIDICTSI